MAVGPGRRERGNAVHSGREVHDSMRVWGMGAIARILRARWEGFLTFVSRPLEWSRVDRALLLTALPMLGYAVGTAMVERDLLTGAVRGDIRPLLVSGLEWARAVVAGYAVVVGGGLILRYRAPRSRLFVDLTLSYFAVDAVVMGILVGPYASPVWLSTVGVVVLGLLLLNHGDVLAAFVLFLLLSGAVGGRLTPHRGLAAGYVPPGWWDTRMGVLTVMNALVVVGLSAYVIGRWRAREEMVRSLSNHDDLTGLANRRYLGAVLAREFERARRYGRPLSCAIVDIDHFKRVNDVFGHQAGDRVLQAVARRVASMVRVSDTVARYGGDEFMLVLPETSLEGAREVSERCRAAIAAVRVRVGAHDVGVTASVGITSVDHPAVHSVDDLIRITDATLYAAKERGRDRVEVAPLLGRLRAAESRGP